MLSQDLRLAQSLLFRMYLIAVAGKENMVDCVQALKDFCPEVTCIKPAHILLVKSVSLNLLTFYWSSDCIFSLKGVRKCSPTICPGGGEPEKEKEKKKTNTNDYYPHWL